MGRKAVLLMLVFAGGSAAAGQTCGECSESDPEAWLCSVDETIQTGTGCIGLKNCQDPVIVGSRIEVVPKAGGAFEARLVVDVKAPWNSHESTTSASKLHLFWRRGSPATNPTTSLCQLTSTDRGETYVVKTGLTCAGAPYAFGTYSLRALVCQGISCQRKADLSGLSFTVSKQALGCPEPPRWSCCGESDCKSCLAGGGASPAGEGACATPEASGPGAVLRYRAGGAGGPGWPGSAAWNAVLGRYWSHDYAERIVPDPGVSHVWLLTRFATFREFTDSNNDGLYETVSPSDERRTLRKVAGGWELRDLEGTVTAFDEAGLWTRTEDRHGNAKTATYSGGLLAAVAFPDGRSEEFTYQAGRLHTIREVGVGAGAPSHTWTYTWSGLDLIRIERPDGSAWEMTYSADPSLPGYLTRLDLKGSAGGLGRVERAWEYDARGNVLRTWRGDPSPAGPGAVDRYSLVYDAPHLPARTEVTDPLGQVTVYEMERDPGSRKPRITRIEGDCPTCGSGPNATFEYGDAANPLLPTVEIDGRNLRTEWTYDARGQVTRRLDAAGTPLQRATEWQYHPDFPALVTRVTVPSTSGGAALRETVLGYDAQGNLTTRTEQGAENGGAFSLTTSYTYNTGGQVLSVDPPGHGTADIVTFAYDPARGNGLLVPLSRTEPLIGATTFTHDAFNRRTAVTDVNNVETRTAYDDLDRVTSVTQVGDGDLVTAYTYTTFGEPYQTTLPRGNVVENGYDGAGRMVLVERKPDASTPGERASYTLDAAGHRVREELQRWDGAAWVTESATRYVFSSRCHLDQVIRGDGTADAATTEYSYDCSGNLEKVWDANHPRASNPNPTQLYGYDALDRLTSVTVGPGSAAPATTFYGYDVQDHLTAVTDAEGNLTTYVYSDRDLLTRETSPVSGVTSYSYDEHGELTSELDARGVAVTYQLDLLDRVTLTDYPGAALDIFYTYDAGAFGKGRLSAITRNGGTVAYSYDRFGRTLQDGALGFSYDANGNQTEITYPGGVKAVYTHDFADREATLAYQASGESSVPLVTASSYKPLGPLAGLTLGNSLVETRAFNPRYDPAGVTVPGRLAWTYTTDRVGNVTGIADGLNSTGNRTYGYQDFHYFLTRGDGPWGTRSWTYDRIGNRLTETKGGVTETYTYFPNAAGGHDPRLSTLTSAGGESLFRYDAAGNLVLIPTPESQFEFHYDAAGRLARIGEQVLDSAVYLSYDGRGFLSTSSDQDCACSPVSAEPTYSSEGLLYQRTHRSRTAPSVTPSRAHVFYFAGRPVALLDNGAVTYLTTDHLGTPALATNSAGVTVWQGGFEPFGADWNGAQAAGVFLRFPGQWEDRTWEHEELASGLYYNVHRWYETRKGLYTRPDPLRNGREPALYSYAQSDPVNKMDPNGESPIAVPPSAPALCAYSIAKEARRRGTANGWPWSHCWASCEIKKQCGTGISHITGMGKELWDLLQCGVEVWRQGDSSTEHCRSAFQRGDFEDNETGRMCPEAMSCDEWCYGFIGRQDSSPGWFYGRRLPAHN